MYVGALNIFPFERRDHGVEVVAHQVEFAAEQPLPSPNVGRFTLQRMNSRFGGRHRENQPAFSSVHARKLEDVAKKGAVRVSVFAVQKKVRADNHAAEYSPNGSAAFDRFGGRF